MHITEKGEKGEPGDTGNGIESTVLNDDYTLTITFTNGETYTTPSIRGAKGDTGETGNGIASTALNADYTLTITFTDGTTYTTPSIRGAQGAKGETGETGATGNGISSVTKTGTVGNVDTYTITFTNGTTTTFTVTNGNVTSVNGRTGAVTGLVDLKYDDSVQVKKITDTTITMAELEVFLNEVNSAGDHVVFNVSAFKAMMFLCTIYLDQTNKFCRIADQVTGIEKKTFYKGSDTLSAILNGISTSGKHYTFVWNKTQAKGTRLNDAANITTDTTHFGHFGSVDANYDNPFDNIYPWSGRKLCNIDIDLYRGLTTGDGITDCVTYWEGDDGFSYDDEYGVWVYTPAFFGRTFEAGNDRYFDVTDELTQGNISYPAMITGRWHGVKKL